MELLGEFDAGAIQGHFFVPNHVVDPANDGQIRCGVVAAVGPIPFGFQLWNFALPLAQQMFRHASRLGGFADGIAFVIRFLHCIECFRGFSSERRQLTLFGELVSSLRGAGGLVLVVWNGDWFVLDWVVVVRDGRVRSCARPVKEQ